MQIPSTQFAKHVGVQINQMVIFSKHAAKIETN